VYEVLLHKAAERALKRLSQQEFTRVIAAIKALGINPRSSGCRKLVDSQGDWRIRVGDYRVLYEIDDEAQTVKVLLVRHRREAYR
jgi:mRNA interferase RelE/StbE